MENTAEKIMQAIKTAENKTNLWNLPSDFIGYADIQEMLTESEKTSDLLEMLTDYFEDSNGLLNVEIIYYSEAMKYLQENDPSLVDSLYLAAEYRFDLKNLNSEILASILASEQNRESFGEFLKELENELESLELEFIVEESENEKI
jgi:hypothetical protein